MMNIAAAKEQIKDTVEAYLQRDDAGMYVIDSSRQRPIFLVGAPGIGKTAIITQIAQELGIGVVSYSMTHHTRQSALGLPRIEHRSFEGFEYEASEYTMSEIVSAIYDYMEATGERRGILFLDEINCVSETLYPSMLQFLQFKTFGRHRVPEDWIIVCAGNPPEYNKSVHEFDIVTLDRLREIDVEPEYAAFKRYAAQRGLHPAVTTFLEAKPDNFYLVESKPGGGKSFVTARGWEDLAEVISLYERLGKTCDRELFAQFLRDDDIADKFSVYYELFQKYRSDYQISHILEGEVSNDILSRAQKAAFDERLALLGLLLDALGTSCSLALDQEGVVVELRDELRAAKPKLMDGATVDAAIGAPLRRREEGLQRKVAAGTAKQDWRRRENLVVRKMREIMAACTLAGTEEGDSAFNTVNAAYRAEVGKIEPLVAEADRKMNNAFSFVERAFGTTREMIVFVAELSTRATTTKYLAHYGNDKYYAHNDELQVDETRKSLSDRVKDLVAFEAGEDRVRDYVGDQMGALMAGASGLKPMAGSSAAQKADAKAPVGEQGAKEPERDEGAAADGATDGGDAAPFEAAPSGALHDYYGDAGREEGFPRLCKMTLPGEGTAEEYYDNRAHEYGFASMSKMTLPALSGKRVLDVCCRRGKGVFKLSAMVGESGHVVGVDWSARYIADAKGDEERAWRKNHLKKSNMEFKVAYPEDLMQAGIGDQSFDVVYINNVMTLVYDQAAALAEFARVLKPGGLLICETIFSDKERDLDVVRRAREIGNSVQAGRTREEFFALLAAAGFGEPEVVDEYEVAANQGFKANRTVEVVESGEEVTFSAVALNVRKPN